MQSDILPQLTDTLAAHPNLTCPLMPLEQQMRQRRPSIPSAHSWKGVADVAEAKVVNEDAIVHRRSFISRTVTMLKRRARGDDRSLQPPSIGVLVQRSDRSDFTASVTSDQRGWLLRLRQETSLGVFVRDLI
jgi:hypothetical protein